MTDEIREEIRQMLQGANTIDTLLLVTINHILVLKLPSLLLELRFVPTSDLLEDLTH